MNFSAHSGVDYLSFGALAWDLVSIVRLYDSKSKGYSNVAEIYFQVKGVVFALGTDVNGDSIFHIMFQKGVFWRSRGRSSEKIFWEPASDPYPSSFLFYNSPMLWNTIGGMCASIFSGARSFWQTGEFISTANYTWHKYNLVSINWDFSQLAKTTFYIPFTTAGMVFFSIYYQSIDVAIAGQYPVFKWKYKCYVPDLFSCRFQTGNWPLFSLHDNAHAMPIVT